MISIKITKKHNALVDFDYEYLQAFSWSVIRPGGNILYTIRKIPHEFSYWNMSWDVVGRPKEGFVVDHINGEGLDNRKVNLRIITYRQNSQNRHTKGTSSYPGVHREGNKWAAAMTLNGLPIQLGTYTNELEAFNTYKATNESLGFPEVIMPFTEEAPIDYSKVTRNEYFHMFQLMKQDGLSDQEIDENLKGVEIVEEREERQG